MFETTLTVEPKTISLAGKAIATVRITGTEPIRVSVPLSILDETTSLNWNIAPYGPAKESHNGAIYVWQQQYHLSPFIVGDGLLLQLDNFSVNSKPVTMPAAQVSVSTSVQSLTSADVRPVTPLELTQAQQASSSPVVAVLGLLVGIGLLLSVVGTWLWLRRKSVTVVSSPLESLRHDLETWSAVADKTSAQELAKRIRSVFTQSVGEVQADRFARLDRWLYSVDVPTTEEMKAELVYWREKVAEQLTPRVAAQPTVMP